MSTVVNIEMALEIHLSESEAFDLVEQIKARIAGVMASPEFRFVANVKETKAYIDDRKKGGKGAKVSK